MTAEQTPPDASAILERLAEMTKALTVDNKHHQPVSWETLCWWLAYVHTGTTNCHKLKDRYPALPIKRQGEPAP